PEGGFEGRIVANVEGCGVGYTTSRKDRSGHRVQFLLFASGQDDFRAVSRKAFGDSLTDAAAPTRDESDFSCKELVTKNVGHARKNSMGLGRGIVHGRLLWRGDRPRAERSPCRRRGTHCRRGGACSS